MIIKNDLRLLIMAILVSVMLIGHFLSLIVIFSIGALVTTGIMLYKN